MTTVVVMFCDLVDSTGIAAKLDAEEWRDLVSGYLDAPSAAEERPLDADPPAGWTAPKAPPAWRCAGAGCA